MKLINRGNKQSPIARQACEIALATHHQRYGDYGRSYVATAMTGMRRLRALPGQVI